LLLRHRPPALSAQAHLELNDLGLVVAQLYVAGEGVRGEPGGGARVPGGEPDVHAAVEGHRHVGGGRGGLGLPLVEGPAGAVHLHDADREGRAADGLRALLEGHGGLPGAVDGVDDCVDGFRDGQQRLSRISEELWLLLCCCVLACVWLHIVVGDGRMVLGALLFAAFMSPGRLICAASLLRGCWCWYRGTGTVVAAVALAAVAERHHCRSKMHAAAILAQGWPWRLSATLIDL